MSKYSELRRIAQASLEANIVTFPSGRKCLRAGAKQFQALWVRDFCFASRGLMEIGRFDVVRDQLEFYLKNLRPKDGLVPRFLDSVLIEWRYIKKWLGQEVHLKEPLKPSYRGWYFQPTIDSNALLLITACDYVKRTGQMDWWDKWESQLLRVWHFYEPYWKDGLIEQPGWSDWQDSVKRKGHTSFVNLVVWVAAQKLMAYSNFKIDPSRFKAHQEKILSTFIEQTSGLFLSVEGYPHISLDTNLMALDWGLIDPKASQGFEFYQKLSRHPIWTLNDGFPGLATLPDYPKEWVGFVEWLFAVRHYHDHTYWSWLIGLSSKVALLMGDTVTADRIFTQYEKMAIRDGWIAEIFRESPPYPVWSNGPYIAEMPFSWGAGMTLDALSLST